MKDRLPKKTKFLVLALLSVGIDSILSLLEIPFFGALPLALTAEEILELVISTVIAGNRMKLDWIDRLLGFLPIPGVTAITVRLIRNHFKKDQNP
jgi:hypothetical protein